tara:strand:- start:2930 stop:3310 length:381 start_codon:yes stop_codon:yes gene_type:complete
MSLIFKKNIKTTILTFLFFLSTYVVGEEKSINYKCTGLSQFELLGSSGIKEEIKINDYKFVDGVLQGLNNIECSWKNNIIKCDSNFLNVRRLSINLDSQEVSDYLNGNKGFGVYVENFKGKCKVEN